MWIEKDILPALAGTGRARVYHTKNWWSQVKTAGTAIYANRHYLELFRRTRPERLARNHDGEEEEQERPKILENVFIHHGAKIHPEAVVSTIKCFSIIVTNLLLGQILLTIVDSAKINVL